MRPISLSRRRLLLGAAASGAALALPAVTAAPIDRTGGIDRKALVTRHNPRLTRADPSAPLMLGNGNIGFTADITGLQTFTEPYSRIAPLLTEAQWAWHSFPNPQGHTVRDTQVEVEVRGHTRRYGYIRDWADAAKNPAVAWIRENPHRFSLGRLALDLRAKDGSPARFADITGTRQELDLWTGTLTSRFAYDGETVTVVTRVLPDQDTVMAEVTSALVKAGRLGVAVRFPGVSKTLNPDPSDWSASAAHATTELSRKDGEVRLQRIIDDTTYHAAIGAPGATIEKTAAHAWRVGAPAATLTVMVQFSPEPGPALPGRVVAARSAARHWLDYWSNGGIVDFSGSTDPRAGELERRVILSQYLMAVNAAGRFAPQEEGLFSNSWNGKSHLEMHPWHAAHFALWGRPRLLENSLGWYVGFLPKARARAAEQGLKGAWWPKMIGPDGVDSPSKVSPFIMWQQPHPIYMSELLHRAGSQGGDGARILATYGELVEQTADLLASFASPDGPGGRVRLGPPIIPVQENFPHAGTFDPAFEVAYYRWGIETAQAWRERAGKGRRADWDALLARWPDLPRKDGLYLPVRSEPGFWDKAAGACKSNALEETCQNRDHMSFLMPLGWLPGRDVDKAIMRRTLDRMKRDWDLRQTWGWDYPMMAMTATRLGAPEEAIDWLFFDAKNNAFGTSGMTPRVHLDAHAAAFVPTATGAGAQAGPGQDGPGYQRAAETYFPSNGGLLLAVALMAGGWDGQGGAAPGFPKRGWKVRAEGLLPSL
ncbi:hypothetical protein GJV26_23165 [Massilia dura]|uniref:Glycoside hydrolase family 65 n=1 Tax=Pseudoduganella dura TaxID=321982 RepID=A0A6I3XEH5_9BURK|nr:hypothetical protein [Pseudoduganella dura]MUI15334.1 hypothetical protein [Pseudoduganella dura]GGX80669.1 hypothetical protein GCM10007386_09630 [Pseudoduganella dura]